MGEAGECSPEKMCFESFSGGGGTELIARALANVKQFVRGRLPRKKRVGKRNFCIDRENRATQYGDFGIFKVVRCVFAVAKWMGQRNNGYALLFKFSSAFYAEHLPYLLTSVVNCCLTFCLLYIVVTFN